MLLERDIKNYIRAHQVPSILNQIAPNFDGAMGQLSISIKLDMTKMLRQHNDIGVFLIGNYPRFTQLMEETVLQSMQEKGLPVPEFGINASYTISNCTLSRYNLESIQFLNAAFDSENGVLVYLKDAQVLHVGQPELYLFTWEQIWLKNCGCSSEKMKIRRKQTLVDIVNNKCKNLREAFVSEIPTCTTCSSKLLNGGAHEQIFNNCQRLKLLVSSRSENRQRQNLFQKGEIEIYLDEGNSGKLSAGDVVDICGYFAAEPRNPNKVRSVEGLLMICYYPCSSLTSSNNAFFSRLVGLDCEYISCNDPREQETISCNYQSLLKTINCISFPYLRPNSFSAFKLVLLNSLFSQMHRTPLHILAITDEVNLLEKAVRLEGVSIRKWPSLYDYDSLLLFLHSCHNCILLVINPVKKDLEYIGSLLKKKILNQINFTLWILCEPNKDLKRELSLEKIHVVIDLSQEKNLYVCRNAYDDLIDDKLQAFITLPPLSDTVPKSRPLIEEHHYNEVAFEGIQSSEEEMIQENDIAQGMLEKYFLKARQYKQISVGSLNNIRKLAEGFSYFRSYLRLKGSINQTKPMINILDAILAIFIEQESSRSKYSSSNTLFSNEVSKLLLNEGDCELSFWDYELDENQQIGEAKRFIKKEDMFKRVVTKLVALLYNGEIL